MSDEYKQSDYDALMRETMRAKAIIIGLEADATNVNKKIHELEKRAEKAEAERADLANRVMALNLEKMELHARLAAAMNPQWISVDDALPEPSTSFVRYMVLAWYESNTDDGAYVVKAYWNKLLGWRIEGSPSDMTDSIHYWMPLPSAPLAAATKAG